MRRVLALLGTASLLTGMTLTGAATKTPAASAAQFSAGLVTDVGGINDKSFNHLAYIGLEEAGRVYKVKANYVESKSQADYVPNLTNFARQHYGITIAVGFLMDNAIYQVAKEYPTQKFAIVDGNPVDPKGNNVHLSNVAELHFKEQQSGYLVGVIAGLMEKEHVGKAVHNTIGAMGGLSIPPVNRYIAGYVAGAEKVDPGIHIKLGYSQSFTDQGRGRSIGLAQISQGADILFQVAGASGLGYLAAAQQRGVYGIGVDADQGYLGNFVITSALKKVNVAVQLIIHDAMTGKFRGGDHEFDLSNNATGFARPSSLVPASIRATANMYAKLIASHKIVPPTNIPPHS